MIDLTKKLYFPHIQHPNVLSMGIQKLSSPQWLEFDSEAKLFYQNKLAQYQANQQNVYRALDESIAAQEEFRQLLLTYLVGQHGGIFKKQGDFLIAPELDLEWRLTGDENLWQSSLWIADDVCILLPDEDDYKLVAASIAAPSHWYLSEKIGQPLAAIHKPIPGFDKQLTPSINRFLNHLKVEHPIQRFNWSVQPTSDLSLLDNGNESAEDTQLFWRVERQTLRRLEKTGAVVFTIKVIIHSIDELAKQADAYKSLLVAIDNSSDAIKGYKDFNRIRPLLDRYGY
jgi:hypothetical protein|tara:strand:+ start:3282 stop:4136 length:855 start_codon:yes stop_codon:yes gene_type:complete